MYKGLTVGAVIPARDEAANIAAVVGELLSVPAPNGGRLVDDLVVCDNGSTDATAALARTAGARVVAESTPGYGIACQCAVQALRPVDVVLFVDGDRAFDVQQSLELLAAIDKGADLVIGSRSLGSMQPGALSAPQLAGNWVAGRLLYLFWRASVTDLGPFRAIRSGALRRLDMRDPAYGWTVEMQIKALQRKLSVVEVPVETFQRRGGKSKVGGTVKGVVGASLGILGMILKLWLTGMFAAKPSSSARSTGDPDNRG